MVTELQYKNTARSKNNDELMYVVYLRGISVKATHLRLKSSKKKRQSGALSSRYVQGLGKGRTTRVYHTQSYLNAYL